MAEKFLSITYEEPESLPSIPVSGAYGGPSPDGSTIFVHVYTEYIPIPMVTEHPLDAEGVADFSIGTQRTTRRGDLTRKVQATLVFTPEVAARVGKWLAEKGNKALAMRESLPRAAVRKSKSRKKSTRPKKKTTK